MEQVLVLVLKGAELWEIAAFTDVFGWDRVWGSKGWRLVLAGPDPEVRLSFGHRLAVDMTLDQVRPEDYAALALPGGFPRYGYFRCCGQEPLALVRAFAEAGKSVAAVCTGTLLLARAGVLAGRRAATYDSPDTDFLQQLRDLGAVAEAAPLVSDGPFLTGNGPGAATAVALALLERCTDPQNRERIAAAMGLAATEADFYTKG